MIISGELIHTVYFGSLVFNKNSNGSGENTFLHINKVKAKIEDVTWKETEGSKRVLGENTLKITTYFFSEYTKCRALKINSDKSVYEIINTENVGLVNKKLIFTAIQKK